MGPRWKWRNTGFKDTHFELRLCHCIECQGRESNIAPQAGDILAELPSSNGLVILCRPPTPARLVGHTFYVYEEETAFDCVAFVGAMIKDEVSSQDSDPVKYCSVPGNLEDFFAKLAFASLWSRMAYGTIGLRSSSIGGQSSPSPNTQK
jgi:hypothetical protein